MDLLVNYLHLKIRVVRHSSDKSINEKQNSCSLLCVIRSEGHRHFGMFLMDYTNYTKYEKDQ